MTNIAECGHCRVMNFCNWYRKDAPKDRYGRIDRGYMDSDPVAFCSEECRDADDVQAAAEVEAAVSSTPKPCGGPMLAAAAALHQLLAAHPELTSMPIRWTLDAENGVSAACLEYMDPCGPEFAEILAKALGTSLNRTGFRALYRGERKVCLSVDGEIGGVLVSFSGYALAAGGGE
jgi:hypothetical protein